MRLFTLHLLLQLPLMQAPGEGSRGASKGKAEPTPPVLFPYTLRKGRRGPWHLLGTFLDMSELGL